MTISSKRLEFAHLVASGEKKGRAYRIAYKSKAKDATCAKEATEVLKDPDVQRIIAEDREKLAERHNITQDSIVAELEEARQIAKTQAVPSAMVSATMGKARVCGLLEEERKGDTVVYNILPSVKINNQALIFNVGEEYTK